MLTRLEVDGFKNLVGLEVDFGPFTCIAGPNAAGKSNVFDAVHFLSLLADQTIMDAAQAVRSSDGRSADPRELFWTDGQERADEMKFVAEMVTAAEVTDDFGRESQPSSTFLRYELRIGYEHSNGSLGEFGRLVLRHESLDYIPKGKAGEKLPWASKSLRDAVVDNKRRTGSGYISTTERDGEVVIEFHGDGGSRGRPRPQAARATPRTGVCTTTTDSDPTILAARREMQAWRTLALEPSAMRSPDEFRAPTQVAPNGAHLAATLFRLATAAETPEDVYARVANRLADLVDAREIRVNVDQARELLTMQMRQGADGFLPARSLSDGTLRFLALAILDADPTFEGLMCMEEPENGIHPERIAAIVDLVRGLAVDPQSPPGPDNPLRQVIVNTHSPAFVQLQRDEDLLLAREARLKRGEVASGPSRSRRVLRLAAMAGTWRAERGHPSVGSTSKLAYLVAPQGQQLELGAEDWPSS